MRSRGAKARRVDPITLEVIRSATYSIAEEMRIILMRSARSTLLKEAGDLSCALTDAQGQLIAQGSQDIPAHLGTMSFTVKEFLKRVPADSLRDGDVFICNLPSIGGNHLPDVKLIKPVFFEGQLVAFAVNTSHWPDVGGALPGSYVPWATELYQEGLQIPLVRLFDSNGPVPEVFNLILENVRGRTERKGDLLAQHACVEVGARRLTEIFQRYSSREVLASFERMLDESELLMRAAISEVPDGTYEAEDYLDDDGISKGPIRIRARITIDGEEVTLDFSGTDPQTIGPLNTTFFVLASAVYYTCKAVLGPSIPPNEGCYRPIMIAIPPPGTILNPSPTAPVVAGNHETPFRVIETLIRAFAQASPDRVVAAGSATAALLIFSGHREEGIPYNLYEVHGGGEGGSYWRDGGNAVRIHWTNVMNTPCEVIEHEYPLRVERFELRVPSAGAGRHRGGFGIRRSYVVLDDRTQLTTMIERCKGKVWGLFGGEPALSSCISLRRKSKELVIGCKDHVELERGDVITIETAGGGGYGRATERTSELRQDDEAAGFNFAFPRDGP